MRHGKTQANKEGKIKMKRKILMAICSVIAMTGCGLIFAAPGAKIVDALQIPVSVQSSNLGDLHVNFSVGSQTLDEPISVGGSLSEPGEIHGNSIFYIGYVDEVGNPFDYPLPDDCTQKFYDIKPGQTFVVNGVYDPTDGQYGTWKNVSCQLS